MSKFCLLTCWEIGIYVTQLQKPEDKGDQELQKKKKNDSPKFDNSHKLSYKFSGVTNIHIAFRF